MGSLVMVKSCSLRHTLHQSISLACSVSDVSSIAMNREQMSHRASRLMNAYWLWYSDNTPVNERLDCRGIGTSEEDIIGWYRGVIPVVDLIKTTS